MIHRSLCITKWHYLVRCKLLVNLQLFILYLAGSYFYIETSSPRTKGDMARLVSPRVLAGTTIAPVVKCLTFWYHMYGTHVDTLNVYVKNRASLSRPVWTKQGTQGNKWIQAQVDIRTGGIYNVSENSMQLHVCNVLFVTY